jgi:ribonuclease Y
MSTTTLAALLTLGAGVVFGYFFRKQQAARRVDTAEARVSKLLEEAKNKEKEILLEAKSKSLEIQEQAKKQEAEFRKNLLAVQNRLERKETDLEERVKKLEQERKHLEVRQTELANLEEELKEMRAKHVATLERIASLTKEDAKKLLLEKTEQGIGEELALLTRKLLQHARDDAEKKAREIVGLAIERCASEVTSETTTTVIPIPSEEMKGRIIGKEGRNIKTFEQMLGVEIIVDDTPDAVIISGFNSIRRYIAKRTLERLIADGRIQPARIEDAFQKAKQEIAEEMKEAGEQACYELGITDFPPKLVQLIGRLKFRTSYGQNVLKHSTEMAKLAALMAEELGAEIATVKKAALLHDIGKALDQEVEGTHVAIGVQIARKFGLPEKIVNAIAAHHEDVPYESLEAVIVDAADNISGSRPGARRDSYEQYVQRLTELENIANAFPGVEKTYAISAGREIRVFVTPSQVDDWGAVKLAREIASKIEEQLHYPGEIKVHVIRDYRVVEYAR